MYNKRLSKLFACALIATSLMVTGCSSNKTNTTTESSSTQSQDDSSNTKKDQPIMGKITKISGKKITLALVSNEGMVKPSGAPSDKKQSSSNSDKSSNNNNSKDNQKGTKPEKPSGDGQQSPEMKLSGEKKTITVTDSTKITINNETKTFSDLKVDDMIQVTMSGNTVTAIQSGMGGGGPQHDQNDSGTNNSSANDSNSNNN